jgi:hypothetical protein
MKMLAVVCLVALFVPGIGHAQKTVSMTVAEHKGLNTFFSNFSEVNLRSFKKGALDDKALLDFTLWHCVMNAPKSFKTTKDGLSIIIPAVAVDKVTERYFGKKLSRHAKKDYTAELATGEAYVFSQVDALTQLADGTYLAKGTVYYTGSGGTPDPQATPRAWAKAGEDVRIQGTFSGIIEKVKADGKERSILLEYTATQKPDR